MRQSTDADNHARIFGAAPPESGAGRSRLCRSCGDWHRTDKPWPHNCRAEAVPRSHLAAPRIAPKFEAFRPDMLADTIIGDPRSKRAYMDQHGLVDYDAGVAPDPEPTTREWEREFVADFKQAQTQDPLAVEPVEVIGRTDLEGMPEVDISTIEVAT